MVAPLPPVLLPCLVVQAFILVNTFPSVRTFSTLFPKGNTSDKFVDVALVLVYAIMTYALGEPFWYPVSVALMFVLATVKYVLMRKKVPHPAHLNRKIAFEILGTLSALCATLAVFLGYTFLGLWAWAIGFSLAQIDIFFLHPLYALPPPRGPFES
jgi:hypothetical protein